MAPLAAAFARQFQAKITIIHVMDAGHFSDDFDAMENQFGVVRDAVRGQLQRFQQDEFSGLSVDRVFQVGGPVDEIVSFARESGADLIVMPTHGRTRFRELLLGSITAGVLHDSGCAVLTAAHTEATPPPAILPQSVLCAIDLSPVSTDVLAAGKHFAEACGASLQVIHVLPPIIPGIFGEGLLLESQDHQVKRVTDHYNSLARLAEVTAPFEAIRASSVADAVIDAEAHYRAGLLVIGRGKLQGVLGRLRTGAHELIRRSTCPVLSY